MPTGRGLIERVAALIAPGVPIEQGEGQEAILQDSHILEQLLNAGDDRATIRLWNNRQCLITTRPIARREGFAAASEQAERAGWPVYIRHSGGATVVHRRGILNVSLFRAGKGSPPPIEAPYEELIRRIATALKTLGIAVSSGSLPGSYCDGRFNILASGRKIAGTACHSRIGSRGYAQLAHASLVVEGDIAGDIEAISDFEQAIGIRSYYSADAHATLCALLEPVVACHG